MQFVPAGKSIFAHHAAKMKGVESMDTESDTSERIDISAAGKRFGKFLFHYM